MLILVHLYFRVITAVSCWLCSQNSAKKQVDVPKFWKSQLIKYAILVDCYGNKWEITLVLSSYINPNMMLYMIL